MRGDQKLQRAAFATAALAAAVTGTAGAFLPAVAAGPLAGSAAVSEHGTSTVALGLTSTNAAPHARTAVSVVQS